MFIDYDSSQLCLISTPPVSVLFDYFTSISLCQVTSHSRESKCILGIATICRVSKTRCSVVGELTFSFASKWFVLVVLKSAIVNCMIEKVKTSPRRTLF